MHEASLAGGGLNVTAIRFIAEAIDRPLLANMVNGGRTPLLPASDLQALGYRIAIYPALGFLAHGHAVRHAYQDLLDNGITWLAWADASGLVMSPQAGLPMKSSRSRVRRDLCVAN